MTRYTRVDVHPHHQRSSFHTWGSPAGWAHVKMATQHHNSCGSSIYQSPAYKKRTSKLTQEMTPAAGLAENPPKPSDSVNTSVTAPSKTPKWLRPDSEMPPRVCVDITALSVASFECRDTTESDTGQISGRRRQRAKSPAGQAELQCLHMGRLIEMSHVLC